jgi:hypothetical protein
MSFYDNEGNIFAERAIEITSAFAGRRPNLKPLSTFIPSEISFNDAVEILEVKELRRKEFIQDATRMGMALVDHLEDKEGWHGLYRQEQANK